MRFVALVSVCLLGLTACSEQQILTYQDRPAETVQECEAAYQAARQRGSGTYTDYSSGASVLGASIGRGLARGMIDSAYRSCLARVTNGQPVAPMRATAPVRATNYRERLNVETGVSATCPAGANVLHGGSRYCPR
ncbi:hypothetical protein [Marivita hallyeonensis]|uniref:Lipoprotein n=1 Tax=Marivita hallyeonensis TaxID=996342 RepID=A0A1M5WWC7_9RHOB|nr:hypothetical protein [Marivita hallyeonensis]SHH91801.1 hypothetical protein SAMN05443551_3558 [Marivita hallyeonensis]